MDWLENIGNDLPTEEHIEALNIETPEDEWHKQRLGKFTSSRLGALMSRGRGKDKYWGDGAMTYIYEKIAEILTGVPSYTPETASMQWGTDNEDKAIDAYEKFSGNIVTRMGKVFIPFNDNCGGSPDGFLEKLRIAREGKGIIEVKCPYVSGNHIKTWITGEVSKPHMAQCQGNMLFSGRDFCDYISFDPRMPESMQIKVIRIERDEEICDEILERITRAVEKIKEIEEQTGMEIKIKF